jgi:hypothetical protein
MPEFFNSKTDRLLAFFGAASVGVSYMEPRLFWLGAIICYLVAAFVITVQAEEFRKFYQRRAKRRKYKKRTKFPVNLVGPAVVILFCITIPVYLFIIRPPDPVLNYGVLRDSWYTRLYDIITRQRSLRIIEIGNSGAKFRWGGPDGQPLFQFWTNSALSIKSRGGQLLVSTNLFDRDGKLIARIEDNEWKVATPPLTYDRNYSSNAFEVVGTNGLVVLQIVMKSDRVQIQGIWYGTGHHFVAMFTTPGVNGGIIQPFGLDTGDRNVLPIIKPMFKYPSELHFEELAN